MEIIYFDINNPIEFKEKLSFCLGFFDGIHRGHMKLVDETKKSPCKKAMVTFDVSPYDFLNGNKAYVITSIEDKARILEKEGFDYLICLKTTKELLNLSKEEFINNILLKLNPEKIVCGFDYRFGRKAEGDVEFLKKALPNVEIVCIDEYMVDDIKASTSILKEFIRTGQIEKTNEMLGRPYTVKGVVLKGNQIGRTISFPTANINLNDDYEIPAFGVYATKVKVDRKEYIGVTNVGVHPSIKKLDRPIIETYMIDFDEEIYGKEIVVEFYKHIRGEVKFSSIDELKKQITIDKQKIVDYFNKTLESN